MQTLKDIARETGLGIETIRRLARQLPARGMIGKAVALSEDEADELRRRIGQYLDAKQLVRELTGRGEEGGDRS
jgi:hypothetical protein